MTGTRLTTFAIYFRWWGRAASSPSLGPALTLTLKPYSAAARLGNCEAMLCQCVCLYLSMYSSILWIVIACWHIGLFVCMDESWEEFEMWNKWQLESWRGDTDTYWYYNKQFDFTKNFPISSMIFVMAPYPHHPIEWFASQRGQPSESQLLTRAQTRRGWKLKNIIPWKTCLD